MSYNIKTVRAAAILTDAYVAGTEIPDCENYNQLILFLKAVKGDLTSIQIKIEYTHDGETFYQDAFVSISGGTATVTAGVYSITLSADQNFVLAIPIKCHKVKVSVKGTGTVTSSSLEVKAVLGNT